MKLVFTFHCNSLVILDLSCILGGMLHWETNQRSSNYYQANSIDIEMTAYALMAYIGGRSPFKSRIEHLKIVKWLVKQRNTFGGFASTQVIVYL